jgi:putative membrane protein
VWLFVLTLGVLYARAIRRLEPARLAGDDRPTTRREITLFTSGLVVLWIAADWPIGALAAGYLLSVKTLQYILFVLVAPPLMLLGMPRWLLRRLLRSRVAVRAARVVTRPLVPFMVANAVLIATHLPVVMDGAADSQLGAFLVDLLWIASGFVMWWPALGRLPELGPMRYPARIGYLLLFVFLPTVPASFFTFSDYPIYATYELAPRVGGIGAVTDQRVAGLLMKTLGGFILFGTMSVMFFRWHARDVADEPATQSPAAR